MADQEHTSSGSTDDPRDRWQSRRPQPDEDGAGGSGDGADEERSERSVLRRVLRAIAIIIASLIGGILTMLLLFVLALQTNWAGTQFADFLLALGNPYSEVVTEYDELGGNFITRLELRDFRMYRRDTVFVDTLGTDPVSIRYVRKDSLESAAERASFDTFYVDTLLLATSDTLRLRYDLLGLLQREVRFDEIYLADPVIRARQRPSGAWDILEPFTRDTVQAGQPAFAFRINEFRIEEGEMEAIFDPPRPDSIFRIRGLNVQAGDIFIDEDVRVRLDTLYGAYSPPGQSDWTDVRAGGSYVDDVLDLSGLEIESAASFVTARGRLQMPAAEGERIDNIDFQLHAAPIAFSDLHPFIPALNPNRSAVIDLSIEGSESLLYVDGTADLSDGGSLSIDGALSPSTEGPLEYRAEAVLDRFDPTFFTGAADGATRVNGTMTVDLRGTDVAGLDGTASATLQGSTLSGFDLTSGSFQANFDNGRADVDLTTTWNGSTIAADGYIRPFDETPAYELTGRATSLNLASFGSAQQESDINATFRVAGHGFDPQTAEVDAAINLARSSINDYAVDSGTLQLELANGELTFGTRLLFPDGLLAANGRAELGEPLTYRVDRGRLENVDVAALLGQQAESSVNAAFTLQGTGTAPQQMDLTAVLDLDPSTYGTYRLQDGRIRADLDNGLLNLTALANLAEAGRFDFAAVLRPFDEVETVRITRGEFANVDVGALLQQPDQNSDLSGTATFTVRGFDPETMRLQGQLSLSDSRINEQAIPSASADFNLTRGTLSMSMNADLPQGSMALTGTARPFLDVPTYEITQGEFNNVNLAAFTGNPALKSSLSGTVSIAGTGFDPATLAATGRIDLSDGRINEQSIQSAFIEGRVEGGVFNVDVGLDMPQGSTRLTGTLRPFLETPQYDITQGTFTGLDLAALTGNPDWDTYLTGELSVTGTGFDPMAAEARGTIRLDSSRVNRLIVESGRIDASITGGSTDFTADLDFAEGSARVTGGGRLFDEVPSYRLEGILDRANLGDLLGSDTLAARLTGRFDLEGQGTDPQTMRVGGQVIASHALIEGTEVDTLFTNFQLTDGLLRVDSLLLRSTALDARGAGVIALFDTTSASDFSFTADLKDLQPLRPLLAAEKLQLERGTVEGRVYGRPGTLRFDVTGSLESFIYNDIRLADFEGTLAGEYEPGTGITIAEVRGDLQSIALPQFLIEEADVDITYTPTGLRFQATAHLEEGRRVQASGLVETAPDARRIVLETFSMTLGDDEWDLLQQATITYGDQYRVSNLLLFAGEQQLAVDGVIDPNGQQNLIMTVENVEMGPFADLLNYDGLGGTVTGSLVLTGPAESPSMEGTLRADVASFEESVGDLRLTLDYSDLRLNLNAVVSNADGSELTAEGYIPLDLRVARLEESGTEQDLAQNEVQLAVQADSFSIGWVEPFLDPRTVSEFTGRLTADVTVGGTMESPILDGQARFAGGRIGLPELGMTYRDIRANLALQQNQVRISNFVIEGGGGSIRGDGTINLPELTLGQFNISLRANEFLAIDSQEYRFVIDGDMVLTGTTQRPSLRGDVEVISGEILLTDETTAPELETVQLSSEEIQTVERRFGIHVTAEDTTTFSLYNALAMNLDVSIERNTWIRSRVNPIMDIQFSGDVDLHKNHYEDLNIFGTIEVVPQRSRIVQFGKRFDITSGTLTFRGPAGDPLIDVQAEYDVRSPGFRGPDPGVTITLGVTGRMSERLDLELGSNPQMEYTDIVSFIATGQPASETLQLGGRGGQALLGAGAGIALDQLTAVMEGLAEAGLGLDVVTLDQTEGQTRITAGTYVTPRLFVAVSQPVAGIGETTSGQTNRPSFTIEYEIRNWLLAQLTQRNQVLRVNLQFEYAY